MKSSWPLLNDRDRDALRVLMAFLHGRLSERSIIDWALRIKPHETIKRIAIVQSLDALDSEQFKDPWRSAWRLIEESWDRQPQQSSGADAYYVQRRIAAGERSGSLISAITGIVHPWLNVSTRSEAFSKITPKRPHRVDDLLIASLNSHRLADLETYRLDRISEVDFLIELGISLEGAVNYGIVLGSRIGWEGDYKFWRLGGLHYVSYRAQDNEGREWDVDDFHTGISPSIKLLDAVVKRIGAINSEKAQTFLSRWRQNFSPIYLRLWASLSQIATMTPVHELSDTLPLLHDRPFWDIHAFPEVAELRALSFEYISEDARKRIVTRIKKGPPRVFWKKESDPDLIKRAQQYWSARELRRIEVAGSRLPPSASDWLAVHLPNFPDLKSMDSIRFGFVSSGISGWIEKETSDQFTSMTGEARLRAIETALAVRNSWDDDPAQRASDWIRTGENANLILSDFENIPDGGAEFPKTWDYFGWSHRVPNDDKAILKHRRLGNRVLVLLDRLPVSTIRPAIEGITYWAASWAHAVAKSPQLDPVWAKLWPIAVSATNEMASQTDTIDLNELVVESANAELQDLDTLNTAAGRLVGIFLTLRPSINGGRNPFKKNGLLRNMRDSIILADGKAGLIARHRLIEDLPYFLKADEEWSKQNLVKPLVANDGQSLALWRAIARRTRFTDVLEVIGHQFADRAVDHRLGRETRGSLLSSLILESMHAFRDQRNPVVSNGKVQQTLRAVDDEVRANVAHTVQRFLSTMANNPRVSPIQSAGDIFRSSVRPFLIDVWPQERSLATRGVSAAFADLPAAAGDAFSMAVSTIERFLVPFDCWSLYDFGLGGEGNDVPRLASITTPDMAAALLHLLDLSIGTVEGAVVPTDLAEALDQIRLIAGKLVQDRAFRRLETIARRR